MYFFFLILHSIISSIAFYILWVLNKLNKWVEYFGFFANEPKFISAMQILFLTVWSLSTWVFCDWFSLSSKPIFPSKTYSPPAFLISKNETTLPRLLGEYLRHFCYLLNLYIPSIILSLYYDSFILLPLHIPYYELW